MKTEIQDADTAQKRGLPRWAWLLAIAIPLVIVWLWPRSRPEPVAHEIDPCPAIYPECTGAAPPPMPEWNIPTDPQERAAYDYAHGLPLPAGTPEPVPFDFKAARMSEVSGGKSVAQQYFHHLCRTEDVEVIARRAKDVDGFLLMRPRGQTEDTPEDGDRYGTEEPVGFGWFSDEDQLNNKFDRLGDNYVQPLYGVYLYVEYVKPGDLSRIVRVERAAKGDPSKPYGVGANWRSRTSGALRAPYLISRREVDQITARFGYTRRGLRRPRDREFGIAGGEFLIVDLQTQEVLAVKRTFNSTNIAGNPSFTRWSAARECRRLNDSPPVPYFISKVLIPSLKVNDAFLPETEIDNYHRDLRVIIEKNYAH